jgi:predicted RNA binding protein YcfA (HicA-like mRNA interferase family)
MSHWPSSKARKVLRALLRIGWAEDARIGEGSHTQLIRDGYDRFTWAFHDSEEIGPKMLARIAKHRPKTGRPLGRTFIPTPYSVTNTTGFRFGSFTTIISVPPIAAA